MEYTLDEIMAKGYACLEKELGYIGMERFIVEINSNCFDYTAWQREHFDKMGDEQVRRELHEFLLSHEHKGKGIEI